MIIQKQKLNRAGFTIVELLIVVVVIAILAAITIVAYNGIRQRAVVSSLQSELSSSAKKLETEKIASGNNQYPDSFSSTGIVIREGVTNAYFKSGDTYCYSLTQGAISYYITNDNKITAGLCPAASVGLYTIFAFDTTQANCATTVQLPIALPASAPGSTIDWGDGTTNVLNASLQSHAYASEGSYTVKYDGPISEINTSSITGANRGCLKGVTEWKNGITPTTLSFATSTGLTSVAKPPATIVNMYQLFNGATSFNQDLSTWDTSNVTNMSSAFNGATAFNKSLTGWDTSKVTNMSIMFYNAAAFNQPVGSWNTSNVTDMSNMFYGTNAFNQPIGSWNTGKVTSMGYMFRDATAFNQPLNSWDTSKVTNMSFMFTNAYAFNQPLGSWNTAKVTTMEYMFNGASTYNQNLSTWVVTLVSPKPPVNFSGSSAWTQPKPTWT